MAIRLEPRARVGEVLDAKYCIEEFLGGGAMGNVFRARHVKVGRSFAIKVLHDRLRTDPKILMRFAREAEIAAKLRHENVVGVLDVCEVGNEAFLVMEYAPGRTLAELIAASAPFAHARAVSIISQLLSGLEHAHGLGLIHRDLKPDNVIVEHTPEREIPRIVDFGIAILRENAASRDSGRITTDGLVLGTPQFMAPELATGRAFDHRVDLFALGVICFEMLTGRMPFDGDGVDVALANVSASTPAMGVRVPSVHVDPLLEAFTRKLMAKRPDERFASAADARRVLDLLATDPKAAARDLATATLPRKPSSSSSPVVITPAERMHTPEEMAAIGSAKTQALELGSAKTEAADAFERPATTKRGRVLVALGSAAGAVALAAMLVLGRSPRPAAMQAHPPAPSEAAPAPETVSVRETAAPAATAEPAPAAVEPAHVAPVAKSSPRPRPSIAKAAPASATPTANDVAALYGTVGRTLKVKSDRAGADELWSRYRTIRIQTALGTESDRMRTHELLRDLLARANRL